MLTKKLLIFACGELVEPSSNLILNHFFPLIIMKTLGITFIEESSSKVSLERLTRESKIAATIEDSPRRDFQISTGIDFFNHMLEPLRGAHV